MLLTVLTAGATILSVGLALVLPSRYTATATILPEVQTSGPLALGTLSQLASTFGVNLPGRAPASELYPVIMQSDEVLKQIVYKRYTLPRSTGTLNLLEYWRIANQDSAEAYEDARRRLLKQAVQIDASRRTGVIRLSVTLGNAELAADVANTIVADLDQYVRQFQRTSASEQRHWIEERLHEVKDDLERSEATLTHFRRRNRVIESSPELQLEAERLSRDVQLNTTLFVELKRQYELVRIEEVKNIPIVNVLDSAQGPARRSWPKRRVLVLAGAMLGALLGVILALFLFESGRVGDGSAGARLLRQMAADVKSDVRSLRG